MIWLKVLQTSESEGWSHLGTYAKQIIEISSGSGRDERVGLLHFGGGFPAFAETGENIILRSTRNLMVPT